MLKSVVSVKGIKGFRRVGLAVRDGSVGFGMKRRCGSVASLFANKVPFLVEMGEGVVVVCCVCCDGGWW